MKKTLYLALAVIAMTLVACNSKPAEDQSAEQSQTIEAVDLVAEEPAALEAEEPLEADSLAAEAPDSIAEELPAAEEPAPEEPAVEQPASATPSNKFAIDRSDGNFVTLLTENVTANAEGCIEGDFVFDKIEESRVRLIVKIETVEGSNIGVFPVAVEPGGTKGHLPMCASHGGVFSKITPGEKYKLSIVRAMRL